MVSLIKFILLGIIQGLTEFLPVSSSAHLVFAQEFFRLETPGISLEIALHFATTLSLVVFSWKEILSLTKDLQLLKLTIVSVVFTAIVALPVRNPVERLFDSPSAALYSAVFLIITGVLLFAADFISKHRRQERNATTFDAIIIGIVQGIAVLPGISRSGATISTGLIAGLRREFAVKFAFLISIPAIFGATLIKFIDLITDSSKSGGITNTNFFRFDYLVSMLFAFVFGLIALHIVMNLTRKLKLHYFSYYCWLMGALLIFLIS